MSEGAVNIEFYDVDAANPLRAAVAFVRAPSVPEVGEAISIRGETWRVIRRTWCLDHADDHHQKSLRANVDIRSER